MKTIRKELTILTFTLAFILIFSGTVSAADWTVNPGQNIQIAIDGAAENDTITVNDGGSPYTYTENVTINKRNLTLKANGTVTVSSSYPNVPTFIIEPTGSYSTIMGFIVTGTTNSGGIHLRNGATNCNITGNNATGNLIGIYLDEASNNNINNNYLSGNTNTGILLSTNSNGNIVSGNIMNNVPYGIDVNGAINNIIFSNSITNCPTHGIRLINSANGNSIINNNITTSSFYSGIYVVSIQNATISGNNIQTPQSDGIDSWTSSDINVLNNNFINCWGGIMFYETDNSVISGNTIQNSGTVGIFLHHAVNDIISGNIISSTNTLNPTFNGNGDGIFLETVCSGNTISGNSISNSVNNGIHLWYACNSNIINGNNIITGSSNGIYLQQFSGVGNSGNTIAGNTINSNINGINFYGSSGNTISGNSLSANSNAIFLQENSSWNNINSNIVNSNMYGIYLNRFCDYNTIDNNTVTNSIFDGITMGASTSNTIINNLMSYNGLTTARYGFWSNYYGNTITGNTIINNFNGIGLRNYVSNGLSETINYNRIFNNVNWNLNNLNTNGIPDATLNWWGTNLQSAIASKINGSATYSPWLFMTINATPNTIINGGNSLITVSFNNYSPDGISYTPFDPAAGHIPDGVSVAFSLINGLYGTLTAPLTILTSGGLASIQFNANTAGIQNVNGETDNQIVPTSITIYDPASIGDFVWDDINGNGIQDAGEPGLPGVTVNLYDNTNSIIATTTTNAAGYYAFTNLIPGIYSLGFELPIGYVFSPQDQGGNDATDSDADTATGRTITTILISGENDLTWDAGVYIFNTTSLIVENLSGDKGQTVYLKAKLIDDNTGNGIPGQTISFKVFGVDAGSAATDADGVATISYPINLVGGNWDIDAAFAGTTTLADSYGTGSLKVNQSSIYILTTVSKTNPTVGETITLTFKLGNKGPDPANDVVFTYHIPEGMEFVSIETQPGYPEPVYDPDTKTITWTLGTVPVLDPWFKLNVKVLEAGIFNINHTITTTTYDPELNINIQSITINAVESQTTVNAQTRTETVGMQETGIPIPMMVLAILMVLGGLIGTKRK